MGDGLILLGTATLALWLASPILLALFPSAETALVNALYRWGCLALGRPMPRLGGAVGWILRTLGSSPSATTSGLALLALAAADRARTRLAVERAEEMLRIMLAVDPAGCSWTLLNYAIDIFVNAGLYRRAVRVVDDWSRDAREAGRQRDPVSHTLAHINRAEALHNVGRESEALVLLGALDHGCAQDALAREGRAVLRAWILAHMDRLQEAAAIVDSVDAGPLGRRYEAEVLYTRSLVARLRGDLETAVAMSRSGLERARRASSERNGLVMIAAAEEARGNREEALRLLESAARHRYRGQSAGGLLLLGENLERAGRLDGARAAYERALVEDPESHLCGTIRERLASLVSSGERKTAS